MGLDPAGRLALRREKSAPVVADFRRSLDARHGRFLPQAPITKALNYVSNHWGALIRFLDAHSPRPAAICSPPLGRAPRGEPRGLTPDSAASPPPQLGEGCARLMVIVGTH
jgi:hypothetical protein